MANNKKRGRSKQNKHARRVHQNAESKSSRSASKVSTVSSRTPSDPAAKQKSKTSSGAPVKSRWMAVVIIILAVLMVLSVLLPSLSSIFGTGTTDTSAASDTSEASTESMETVDATYGSEVSDLQTRLDNASNDNERFAPLLNLGDTYLEWASAASPYATDETGQQHVQELYGLAQSTYEEYLALHESSDIRTRVALCQFYAGDVDGAISALESFVATDTGNNYGPAWAYLGMMYQQNGDTEAAKRAYTEATRADADDSYGAKSYATQQLANLQAAESGSQTDTTDTQDSLENMLNNAATSGN